MRRVAIVTDSSACVPPALVRRHGIRVLPLAVHFTDETVADGADRLSARVYEAIARSEPVKSSPPSPAEYLTAIEESGAREVVIITPATEFTSMHRNALLAAELADRPTEVIDARTAAAGQGLVVVTAAKAARADRPLSEVASEADDASARVQLIACLANLGPIRDSGRVPPRALDVSERSHVRPVFRLTNGIVEPLAAPRDTGTALRRIDREWRAAGGPAARRATVFHAGREDEAQRLASLLGHVEHVAEFSAAMAIHTGPWVTGVAWLR
jgi:DegV family protein with EDD domain